MSELLRQTIEVAIREVEAEIRQHEEELKSLISDYRIEVVEEAGLQLAQEDPELQSVTVPVLEDAIRSAQAELSIRRDKLKRLLQLKKEIVKSPGFREDLARKLTAFKEP